MDLEGRDLGHNGTVDILAIYDVEANHTYLFDIYKMQHMAFSAGAQGQWSLKELIEMGGGSSLPPTQVRGVESGEESLIQAKASADGNILFLLFDVRMDSAALFHLYGVRLGGTRRPANATCGNVYDLQVAQVMNSNSKWLIGLGKSLGMYITPQDHAATERGKRAFAPEFGGTYDAWTQRPLSQDLIQYCAVTIRYYGLLLNAQLQNSWGAKPQMVMSTSESRIARQVNQKLPKMRDARRDF